MRIPSAFAVGSIKDYQDVEPENIFLRPILIPLEETAETVILLIGILGEEERYGNNFDA